MARKKRSVGSVFLGFIRGLITLALVLILIVTVGSNVIFYSADSSPKIDILNYHWTFFINNSNNLKNIDEGSMVLIDHELKPEENTYVLCTVGEGYKTVLCLAAIEESENGTMMYSVRGDRMNTGDVYSIPKSKILGTVLRKNDLAGEMVRFSRDIRGIATMAISSLLLIIFSVAAIKRKKSKYDDDMLEAEIYIESLRKEKRNEEKKAEEHRRLMAQKAEQEAEAALLAEQAVSEPEHQEEAPVRIAEPETAAAPEPDDKYEPVYKSEPVPAPADEPEPFVFQEYKRKEEPETPTPAKEPENVSKYEYTDFVAKETYSEQLNPEKPVFQEMPESARPSYRYDNPVQSFANVSEIKHESSVAAETPEPAPAVQKPAEKPAPVKKKSKPPVKKINADSIDDLIRILEEEKRKLD